MSPRQTITTSFLLGNLHCPSCVALIKSLLEETYGHHILWVSPNLVTSVVTVEHEQQSPATVRSMEKTLEDVGFEICGINTSSSTPLHEFNRLAAEDRGEGSRNVSRAEGPWDAWSRLWHWTKPTLPSEAAQHVHRENCEACHSCTELGLDGKLDQNDSQHDLEGLDSEKQPAESPLYEVAIGDGKQGAAGESFRATLSVGGMTCAVCVNTISANLEKYPWVTNVVVNLVSNSATVDYEGSARKNEIVEAIEDLGYDVAIDSVVNLGEETQSGEWREVIIKIDGIFCDRCPDRICQTLKSFRSSQIEIKREPSATNHFIDIRYVPDAPSFTIRHILKGIEATDPSFKASIFHPPTLEERSRAIRTKHQYQLLWREVMTIIVAIPTLVLGIVYQSLVSDRNATRQFLTQPWSSGLSRMDVILCLLATPVYFFAADIFHTRAIKEIRTIWRRNSRMPWPARFYKFGSMNMLMSLGTTIAYVSSVIQMIVVAASTNTTDPSDRFYFDSVVFLTLFLLAGRLIEAYSKAKTGDAVEALAKLRPTTALLVEKDKAHDLTTTTIDIDQLELADIIRVPHGASPAADGVILSGESNFDESSLTGESRLIKKVEDDEVFAGTVNKGSSVTIRVTGTSGKSMLDQIVEVVREGQAKRAPMERVADVLTTYFVPVITLIAIVTWVVWMALAFSGVVPEASASSGGRVAFAFEFAIAVFVVACPCGLGLAAPTAIFVGGSIAAKHGILAKGGGDAFEKASKVDCVVFDKTGTLTVGGEPNITDSVILPAGEASGVSMGEILSMLKALEENSSHPIAKAIVDYCGPHVKAAGLEDVEEVPGRGMTARLTDNSRVIAVGNEQLMKGLSVDVSARVSSLLQTWKAEAKSIVLIAVKVGDSESWNLAGALSISDAIRPEAVPVIKALQSHGTQVWMLSGDNVTTAQAVAKRVGIPASHVLAEVLPSEKAAKISYLQGTLHAGAGRDREDTTRRAVVAMVGDGINDSPALTTADVGIAIGSGSDVAISSAEFVLASSNLASVVTLLELSRAVLRRIRLNFGWALVYNLVAVPIAAGCLYAVRAGGGSSHVKLDPVWASLAMALSSISVVMSSLALRSRVPWVGFRPSGVVARVGGG